MISEETSFVLPRANELILELASQPYKLRWADSRHLRFETKSGRPYEVEFRSYGLQASMYFYPLDTQSFFRTDDKDAFRVLTTVLQALKEYVSRNPSIEVRFTGGDPVQHKFYGRALTRYADKFDLKFSKLGSTYLISKKSKALSEAVESGSWITNEGSVLDIGKLTHWDFLLGLPENSGTKLKGLELAARVFKKGWVRATYFRTELAFQFSTSSISSKAVVEMKKLVESNPSITHVLLEDSSTGEDEMYTSSRFLRIYKNNRLSRIVKVSDVQRFRESLSEAKADPGSFGKKLEIAFMQALKMLGLNYRENGARGKKGELWDFSPMGLGWRSLPPGAKVNLKSTGARTLWTSAPIYKDLFTRSYSDPDEASIIIKKRLSEHNFTDIYWLVPKSKDIGQGLINAVNKGDVSRVDEIFKEKNWSVSALESFRVVPELEGNQLKFARIYKSHHYWAQLRVYDNKSARSTGAQLRKPERVPLRPYVPLKERLEASQYVDGLLEVRSRVTVSQEEMIARLNNKFSRVHKQGTYAISSEDHGYIKLRFPSKPVFFGFKTNKDKVETEEFQFTQLRGTGWNVVSANTVRKFDSIKDSYYFEVEVYLQGQENWEPSTAKYIVPREPIEMEGLKPAKLYHIVPAKYKDLILREGLKTSSRVIRPHYPGYIEKRLYLWTRYNDSVKQKMRTVIRDHQLRDSEFIVLEIDAKKFKKFNLKRDRHFRDGDLAAYTLTSIPASAIRVKEHIRF